MSVKRTSSSIVMRIVPCFLAGILAAFFLASCKEQSKEAMRPQASAIEKESRRGPIQVRLTADRDRITIAENLTLTIEAEYPEGFKVSLPAFGDKLGEFGIMEYREEPPQLKDRDRIATRKVYRLEPFLSGEYKISPMTVTFEREGSEPQPIETEELVIKVESLLGDDRSKLEIHPVFDPVDLPRNLSLLWIVLAVTIVLTAAAGGGYLWLRRRKGTSVIAARPVPAHVTAYRQLDELLRDGLVERGELKIFFVRISDIMRAYIENRFGLHAPRRTTEEFLASISQDGGRLFTPEHRRLLDEFLHRCDLVKFANHLPMPQEAGAAVEACRAFVDATKEEERPAAESEAGRAA